MPGGLMSLVRSSCYHSIITESDIFYEPYSNIDDVIRLYIYVIKQYYNTHGMNSNHINHVIKQFDKYFNNGFNVNTLSIIGNTYLHTVSESFCIELFEYFINKGVNPMIKNEFGKNCFDLMTDENKNIVHKKYYMLSIQP